MTIKFFYRVNDMKLKDLVAPWIQKTSGILLNHQKDFEQRTLMIKESHEKKLGGVKIAIIRPDCKT